MDTGAGAGALLEQLHGSGIFGVLETTQRLVLPTCTHGGEHTLDDDALGAISDGLVERKRTGREGKGSERETGASLAVLLIR